MVGLKKYPPKPQNESHSIFGKDFAEDDLVKLLPPELLRKASELSTTSKLNTSSWDNEYLDFSKDSIQHTLELSLGTYGLSSEYSLLPNFSCSFNHVHFDAGPNSVRIFEGFDFENNLKVPLVESEADFFGIHSTGTSSFKKLGQYELFLSSQDAADLLGDRTLVGSKQAVEGDTFQSVETDLKLISGDYPSEPKYYGFGFSQPSQLEWQALGSHDIRASVGNSSSGYQKEMRENFEFAQQDDEGHIWTSGDSEQSAETHAGNDEEQALSSDDQSSSDVDHSATEDGHSNSDEFPREDDDSHIWPSSDSEQSEDTLAGNDDHGGQDMDDNDHSEHDHDMDGDSDGDGDHDMGDGDDHGGHDHGSNDTVSHIPLPTHPGEIEAYVIAVKAEPEHSDHIAHSDDSQKATEHGQLMDLVPRAEATHIAIGNGDWFDPDTWYNGEIPDEGAKVLIPKGVSVVYDGQSDDSLFTVRVDGELSFATDTDTKMVVDTFVVSPSGRLEIGTAENPIQDDVTAEIVIANNGDIDVNWDPSLLSRGVISHGQVEIHGAEKTSNLRIVETAMAGDTELKLSDIPDNWQVGDTIVVTGTHKQGWFWNYETNQRDFAESQDEEVTITAINGDTVTIDRPLAYDHDTPRDDLQALVANMTRNITFSSQDGEATEVHHRGHVMFMHNQDVDVRYAAFDDLGRTDKSNPAHHLNTLDPTEIQSDTNAQGRYSLHFHRTGTENQDDPAIALGNVVSGSPGWGFVHHSSHANFIDNIAFDVFGAAFVAEDGDETGIWWRNVAIKTEGIGYGSAKTKSGEDVLRDDVGRTGDGFFFSGRLVEAGENIAANTTHGFVWMTRTGVGEQDSDLVDHPGAHYGRETVRTADWMPIQGFTDNEAFGTQVGLIVVKRSNKQGHEVRSVLDGFQNWETSNGVDITYTSHYTLKDFDLLGTRNPLNIASADTGFDFGNQAFDIVVNGLTIANFDVAVDFKQNARADWTDADFGHFLIDVNLINNQTDYVDFNPNRHEILTSADLVQDQLHFNFTGPESLNLWQVFSFDGIKTDSLGSRDRQFVQDVQQVSFKETFLKILQSDGYYKTADGRNVMILEDYISDRATGELEKISHIITLNASDADLNKLSIFSNGPLDLGSDAPIARDDHFSVRNDSSIVLDVLANDFDPDGSHISIDEFTNPFKGDVVLRDDGKLVYTPFDDYEGTDTFDYWTTDHQGNFTRATVTVDVFDMI